MIGIRPEVGYLQQKAATEQFMVSRGMESARGPWSRQYDESQDNPIHRPNPFDAFVNREKRRVKDFVSLSRSSFRLSAVWSNAIVGFSDLALIRPDRCPDIHFICLNALFIAARMHQHLRIA
jgi:hypothetical protein